MQYELTKAENFKNRWLHTLFSKIKTYSNHHIRIKKVITNDGKLNKSMHLSMKLAIILLLTTIFQVEAKVLGQRISIAVTNAPAEQVFKELKRQSGYGIVYVGQVLQKLNKITLKVDNASLEQVLNIILKNHPFEYEILDKIIIIKQKVNQVVEVGINAAPIDVKGRVVNEKGEPVAGVTVLIKGTKSMALTNNNGEFEMSSVDQDAVLIFTSINMETFELKINGKAVVTVTLKTKISELGDVIVTVNTGYQELPKERATGSFEKVDNQLFNRSVTTNVLERLDGVVPGLIFNKLIGTENKTNISIRGISTLFSEQKPLIVVDNFPYNGDISNINPNDVENVTILKDAAASSIWGSRAGNGVIVITTKKGRYAQKTSLSFNSNVTIVDKPDLFYVPQFTSNEFILIEKYLFDKGFYDADLSNTSSYPIVSPIVEMLAKRKAGLLSETDSTALIASLSKYDVRNDYNKYLYRKAVNQQYSTTLSGGTNVINYLFSVGYDKNIASLVGNDQERISFRSLTGIKPVQNLDIQVGLSYTYAKSNNNSTGIPGPGSTKSTLYPYGRLADDNGNYLAIQKDYRSIFTDSAGNGQLLNWKYRPLEESQLNDNESKLNDLLFNLGLTYNFLPGLSAEVRYQFEKQITEGRNYYSPESYFTRNLINLFTPTGGTASINSAIPYGGILDASSSSLTSHSIRSQINFNKKWRANDFTAIGGTEVRQVNGLIDADRTYGYDQDVLSFRNVDFLHAFPTYQNIQGPGFVPNGTSFGERIDRFVSIYANGAYTYDKRYTVSASARRDASNLFGAATNNKWKPLWSVGGAWNLSNESFYKLQAFPLLKLRATYGFSGNVNNSISGVLTIAKGPINNVNNFATFFVKNPPNPTLRWEKIKMVNLGVDFETKNSRISGSLEYYTKNSTDLINTTPADPTTGAAFITLNSANLKGSGLDLSLTGLILNNSIVTWRSNLILSFNKSKIIKYHLTPAAASSYLGYGFLNPIEGQDPYSLLSYKWGGLNPQNGNPIGYLNGKPTERYDSIKNFSAFEELVNHGSSRPLYFGSFRNTIVYKKLSVSFNVTFRLKYYFRRLNTINYSSLFSGWVQNGYADYQKRWQFPGDETSTNVPSITYPSNSDRDNYYQKSQVTVEKGDNIRFQDINISYTLSRAQFNKLPFKAISIYAYFNNIGIAWKANKQHLDPDYEVPPSRSISFGLRTEL